MEGMIQMMIGCECEYKTNLNDNSNQAFGIGWSGPRRGDSMKSHIRAWCVGKSEVN